MFPSSSIVPASLFHSRSFHIHGLPFLQSSPRYFWGVLVSSLLADSGPVQISQKKKSLGHIINASFNTGIFQDKMKIAKVRLLFNKQHGQDVQKYTPISIFFFFHLMHGRLMSFVNKHNILTEAQNRFRKMKSTERASQTFVESFKRPWIKVYMQ